MGKDKKMILAAKKTILAIDTSCDDTSVAVLEGNRVLANVVASQTAIHQQYGGVFPLWLNKLTKKILKLACS